MLPALTSLLALVPVHPAVRRVPKAAMPARRFALAHGAVALLGATLAVLWVAAFGPAPVAERLLALGIAVPAGLAAAVRLTPRLDLLQAASGVASTAFIAALCALSGGLTSPFLPWLILLPAEAALIGKTRHLLAVLGAVVVAVGALTGAGLADWLPPGRVPDGWHNALMGLSLLGAILYGGALVVQIRRDQAADARARAIAEASARFLDEHAGDLVLRIAEAERIAYAGPFADAVLGCADGAAAPGANLLDFVPEDARLRLKHALVRAAYFGERAHTQLRLVDRRGVRWLDLVCRPLEPASPGPALWRRKGKALVAARGADVLVVGRDVTAAKRETDQLVRGKAAAEAQSQAKSLFLANMSHELRTPLNAILGFAQMIDGELFGPIANTKYKEYAGLIEESGRYLLELINDILDLSKVEAGKYQIEAEPVNMAHALERTLRLMAPQFREKGLKLAVEVAPDLPMALADVRCVRQILFNLLSNALKFTPEGGTVTVALRTDEDGIALSVRDTGVGIAEGELKRLANPFEQASTALTTSARGTGLGLALVRRFAQMQGGRFAIESAVGQGTCVTAVFVRAAAQPMDPRALVRAA